jgi:hypothetical protein
MTPENRPTILEIEAGSLVRGRAMQDECSKLRCRTMFERNEIENCRLEILARLLGQRL